MAAGIRMESRLTGTGAADKHMHESPCRMLFREVQAVRYLTHVSSSRASLSQVGGAPPVTGIRCTRTLVLRGMWVVSPENSAAAMGQLRRRRAFRTLTTCGLRVGDLEVEVGLDVELLLLRDLLFFEC